jgi:AraC family transcriptional activator of pobA
VNNHHKDLHSPHRHNFFHLVLFTKGAGSQTIDFENFPVRPFLVYFMIPGQVHSWNFEGEVDGYIINFSESFFQSFLAKHDYLSGLPFFSGIAHDSVLNIPDALHQKVVTLFEDLLSEYHSVKPMANDMIRTLMLQFFVHVARLSGNVQQSVAPSYNYTLLKNFQRLIEQNYTRLKLPKEYAELLYITPNHLNALCNDLLGLSAGEVIRNRVILEAKRMLVNQDMSVQQIADQLNFADNSYFTKFFKKQAGITPEEFRKKSNHHVYTR